MKAVRLHARGGPEQLVYEDAPTPQPGPGRVRVRGSAAGITPTELSWTETYRHPDGSPRVPGIPGHDLAGVVDALGDGVTGVAVGDAVYGLIDFPFDGSLADYAVAPAAELAPAPRTLDPVHAAAVPLSALTAWQALFDHAGLRPGQTVLVHGAAGAVGAYAVKLAKRHGATVIAVASGRHAATLRDIGADTVVDYTTTPFEAVARDVDVVLDPFGGDTRARSWSTLRPGGSLIALNAPVTPTPRDDVKGLFFVVRPNRGQLVDIAALIDAGGLKPAIEAVYPLAETRLAFERGLAGHLAGKIVVRVSN